MHLVQKTKLWLCAKALLLAATASGEQCDLTFRIEKTASPSKHFSRGRLDIEEFITKQFGRRFFFGHGTVSVAIHLEPHHQADLEKLLTDLGFDPIYSTIDAETGQLFIEDADSRELTNIVAATIGNNPEIFSAYDAETTTFTIDYKAAHAHHP